MKVIVLSDNRSANPDYQTEHGLSVYVETSEYRYLLDTGASGLFIRNAAIAGIDLSLVDYVILSHGHSDHTGGLDAFLRINHSAKIIISDLALSQRLYSKRNGFREIGSSVDVRRVTDRMMYVDGLCAINNEARVFKLTETPFPTPLANSTLYKGEPEHVQPDDFSHEIVVVIGNDKPFVFTGCAHKGLLNILHAVRTQLNTEPGIVFGGFHLVDSTPGQSYETTEAITSLADQLIHEYPDTRFFTGHCTGDSACSILKSSIPDYLYQFGVGDLYTF